MRKMNPIHPGEILLEEFLNPMEITQYRLAKDINVPARRINEIVHGKRAISANTALRLAKFFGMSAEFWLNLQSRFDLEMETDNLGSKLDKEVHALSAGGVAPPLNTALKGRANSPSEPLFNDGKASV